jgi:ADP-ribose pyrophosphatase YjhB (NUDIX family)
MSRASSTKVHGNFQNDQILAAGGLVVRQTQSGAEIAIIHRPKYNDWTLPKGKFEKKKDGSLLNTAIRKVKKEIGNDVQATNLVGAANYEVNGIPKIVLFWNMAITDDAAFKPSKEVDRIVWLTPRKAYKKLSYITEKTIIKNEFRVWKFDFISNHKHDRLKSAIDTFTIELKLKAKLSNQLNTDAFNSINELLKKAMNSLNEKKIDNGWKFFHSANRLESYILDSDDLKVKARMLLSETNKSDKLSPWRKGAINKLLMDKRGIKPSLTQAEVCQAYFIRDESFNNLYIRLRLLRNQFLTLEVLLFLVLTLIMCLPSIPKTTKDTPLFSKDILAAVILFGLLGGTVSAILSTAKTSTKTKISEQIATSMITLMRVLVGAASALAVYTFLRAGVIFSEMLPSVGLIMAMSFASGFSERLVKQAVESLGGKSK